jgi:hypothetical protein
MEVEYSREDVTILLAKAEICKNESLVNQSLKSLEDLPVKDKKLQCQRQYEIF